MKQSLNKNPYKFRLFRSHPVLSIISLVVIFAVCYIIGIGRFTIGQVRLSTPNQINAGFVCFVGHISKNLTLSDNTAYTLTIADDLDRGDLCYRLLFDGEEIFSTNEPGSYPLDGKTGGEYTLDVGSNKWTKGSFSVNLTPSETID